MNHNNPFTEDQKAEIKAIVHEALLEFFSTKGSLAKNILVTLATIVGSLAVISGGLYWILKFMGFTYIGK